MRSLSTVLLLGASLGVICAALLVSGTRPMPLYDGVVVQEPYRYLDGGGEVGSPSSFIERIPVTDPGQQGIAAATSEAPPQAQLIAAPGTFLIGTNATVAVSIEPVAPANQPTGADVIAGNVYRFSVAAADGSELAIDRSAPPTLVLRAPPGVFSATIARLDDGAWSRLATQPVSGQPSLYLTNPTRLGDFVLLAPTEQVSPGLDPAALVLIAMSLVIGVGLVVTSYHRHAQHRGGGR